MTKIAVITNCTASGTLPVIPYLDGASIGNGFSHMGAVEEWKERLDEAEKSDIGRCATRSMYTGTSFRTTLATVDSMRGGGIETDLFVVSLGCALVGENDIIPSYNLNIQQPEESQSSLYNIVTAEKFDPIRWWATINNKLKGQEAPISAIIASRNYDLIIVALSNSFLQMVAADIASAAQLDVFQRVRIVGPKGSNWLLKYMRYIAKRGVIMPYSTALNDLIPGNRNDFAQRAAQHFIREVVLPGNSGTSLEEHYEAVASKMGKDNLYAPTTESGSDSNGVGADSALVSEVIETLKQEGIVSISEAYTKAVERLRGRITLRFDKFERAWGISTAPEITSSEMEDALDVLKMTGIVRGYDNQSEVVNALRLFTSALRSRGGGVFTVKDVCGWAKLYFDKRDMKLPETLRSPNKLGRMLSSISDDLQLIKTTNVLGGKVYEIRS